MRSDVDVDSGTLGKARRYPLTYGLAYLLYF